MAVEGDERGGAVRRPARGRRLADAVADIYAADTLDGALGRLLGYNGHLLDVLAGSVSLVHAGAGTYAKVAERGAPCGVGLSFPLDEGLTGRAVARRAPVVVTDYRAVRGGHVPAGHPAGRGAAAAVPIWWRGDVLGVNVAFAGTNRRFTAAELDELELLGQTAAAAIAHHGAVPPPLPLVPAAEPSPMTPREQEVLTLLADGLTDRDIADVLVVSPKTIEKHVSAVLRKTGTTSRAAAVMRAVARGWLPIR